MESNDDHYEEESDMSSADDDPRYYLDESIHSDEDDAMSLDGEDRGQLGNAQAFNQIIPNLLLNLEDIFGAGQNYRQLFSNFLGNNASFLGSNNEDDENIDDSNTSDSKSTSIDDKFVSFLTTIGMMRKQRQQEISRLKEYGHPEFTFQSYFDVLATKVETTSDIDLMAQIFTSLKSPLSKQFGKDKYKFPFCQQEWTQKTWFFRCKDCAMNDTSCICLTCFKKGNHIHEGHSFVLEESVMGGCCDCGNPDSWSPSGFCSDHFLPENPISPSEVIEPEIRKKLHLFIRIVVQQLTSMLNKLTPEVPSSTHQIIITWLEDLCKNSFPVSHIVTEEFTQETLDQRTIDINKPLPLSFITKDDKDDNNNNNNNNNNTDNDILEILKESPIRIIFKSILLNPDVLDCIKTLCVIMMGNSTFKIVFCNEYLNYYPDLSLQTDIELSGLVSYISCQMFEIPSIIIPFCTGHAPKNILSEILSIYKTLLKDRENYDFSSVVSREQFDQIMSAHQDFSYIPNYFKVKKIVEYVNNNDQIFNEILNVLDEIHELTPIRRLLIEPLPYELPILGSLVSIELNSLQAVGNFLKTLHTNQIPSIKYLNTILNHIKPSTKQYFTFNNYLLPSNDLFHAIDTVSLHCPLNRVLSIFFLNSLYDGPHYSLPAIKSTINLDQILYLINQAMLPNILLAQHNHAFWEKNMNINDFSGYYTWSLKWIDLFTIQYCAILLGPNYFLNFLLSSFTSNFKYIEEYKFSLQDMLKFLIAILQLRVSPKHTPEDARYHIIQGLATCTNTHAELSSYRRDFATFNYFEDAIEEVSETSPGDKKLSLKTKYWERYDYYYPYHFCIGDTLALMSLQKYQAHLKKNKYPNPESLPLPPVVEPLHPNLEPINDIYDEPLLYHIAFCTLLAFVHPGYKLQTPFPLSDFINSDKFLPKEDNLDDAVNHTLFLMVMAMRHFKTKTYESLTNEDQESLRTNIKCYLSIGDFGHTVKAKKSISLLNILRPYDIQKVITDNNGNTTTLTCPSMNILDIVTDLFELIGAENRCLDKKNLISNLLIMINEFDDNLSQYFINRKMSIEDIINKQNEDEAQIKKEEALKRQKAIREKMVQQQLQFLKSNSMLDDEDEDEEMEDTSLVCVACKEGIRSNTDPLCAIGRSEGFGIKSTSKRQTLLHYYPENTNSDVNIELESIGESFMFNSIDHLTDDNLLKIFQSSFAMNISCCDHLIHKSCLENFVDGSICDGYRCPLCNRTANILLAINSKSCTESITSDLFKSILITDTTNRNDPTEPYTTPVQKLLWKYPLSNIETLEITSRPNKNYNEGQSYFVYNEIEFQKRLKTLRLVYFNTMSIELNEPVDLFQEKYYNYDPFILATYSYFIDRKSDPKSHIKLAYELLIQFIFGNFIDRVVNSSSNSTSIKDYQKFYKILMQHLESNTIPTDEKQKVQLEKLVKTMDKALKPFIRKSFLFFHCLATDFESPFNNDKHTPLTLTTFNHIDYLLKSMDLPDWKQLLISSQPPNFSALLRRTTNVFCLPSKLPKFIDLAEDFVNFLVENITKPCGKDCNKLPKCVCIICGTVVCDNNCCEDELLAHNYRCQHGVGLFLDVCNPILSLCSARTKIDRMDIYFDKFGEPSTKAKPYTKLRIAALREVYIKWLKGTLHEKYFR